MSGPGYQLDHVALAARDVGDALARLAADCCGTVFAGGPGYGFRWVQVRLGDADAGMTVELLEPWEAERNDFLARFVERNGPGTHHLTFKVPDLVGALEQVRAAGLRPVGIALSDPEWKEAFLHPREAHGTVVQLAQVSPALPPLGERLAAARAHGPWGAPWWPPTPPPLDHTVEVRLDRVVLRTPALAAAAAFFGELLGGEDFAAGEGWSELAWPGGRIRLEQRDGLPPGVDRLEGESAKPRELVVAGTRLLLQSPP